MPKRRHKPTTSSSRHKRRRRRRERRRRHSKNSLVSDTESESSDSDEIDDEERPVVERHGLHSIYFVAEVNTRTVLRLRRLLDKMSLKLRARAIAEQRYAEFPNAAQDYITIYITSDGGSLEAGFAAVDDIASCEVFVNTVVRGSCSSAATLIAVAATHRAKIQRHAAYLIHQLRGGAMGTREECHDELENIDAAHEQMKHIYLTRCPGLRSEDLEELLSNEQAWTADETLERGFVDEIVA